MMRTSVMIVVVLAACGGTSQPKPDSTAGVAAFETVRAVL